MPDETRRSRQIDAIVEEAVRGTTAPTRPPATPKPPAAPAAAAPSRRSPEEMARMRAEHAEQNARDLENERRIQESIVEKAKQSGAERQSSYPR